MLFEMIRNRNGDISLLLRVPVRGDGKADGGRSRKRTVADVGRWPESLRKIAQESFREAAGPGGQVSPWRRELYGLRSSGHVSAIRKTMDRFGLAEILSPEPCPERELVMGLAAAFVIEPEGKGGIDYEDGLYQTLHSTTVAEEFGIDRGGPGCLAAALRWLWASREGVQRRLAERHLAEGEPVLVAASSWPKGGQAQRKRAERREYREWSSSQFLSAPSMESDTPGPRRSFAIATDGRGRPVTLAVMPSGDPDRSVVVEAADAAVRPLGFKDTVAVVGPGTSEKDLAALGVGVRAGWIVTVPVQQAPSLAELMPLPDGEGRDGPFELGDGGRTGERLVGWRDPTLALVRATKRDNLISWVGCRLEEIGKEIDSGSIRNDDQLRDELRGLVDTPRAKSLFHIKKVKGRPPVCTVRQDAVDADRRLDGVKGLRTSLPASVAGPEECVRLLGIHRRAFGAMKILDAVGNRGLFSQGDDAEASAVMLVAMLAYLVGWHMRKAWGDFTPPYGWRAEEEPGGLFYGFQSEGFDGFEYAAVMAGILAERSGGDKGAKGASQGKGARGVAEGRGAGGVAEGRGARGVAEGRGAGGAKDEEEGDDGSEGDDGERLLATRSLRTALIDMAETKRSTHVVYSGDRREIHYRLYNRRPRTEAAMKKLDDVSDPRRS
ncbi:MAG: hypothetical protein LBR80_01965 [Deltaproteobacteria bacterium]|jgi:hypothetical protein|nr:hypothetical protein [Deltaproteobacteria bacterium]